MRHVPSVCLVLAILFYLGRAIFGRDLGDAAHILGVATAVWIFLSGHTQMSPRWIQIGRRLVEWAHRLIFERTMSAFVGFLIYFALSHALLGLGLQDGFGFDVTYFTQAAYNAFHPQAPLYMTLSVPGSFFAHHFEPFLFLLQPLAHLPEPTFWFYLVQDVANAASLVLIAKAIAVQEGEPRWRLTLFLLLASLPFWFGARHYEFHEVALAIPLLLLAPMLLTRKQWLAATLVLFALLSLKETLALHLAWGALVLIVASRSLRVFGFLTLISSVMALTLHFGWSLPRYSLAGESMFLNYYAHLGSKTADIVFSPLRSPLAFLGALFQGANLPWLWNWIYSTVSSLAFAPALLVFTLPDAALVLLGGAQWPTLRDPHFQYGCTLIPWVCLAASQGFPRLRTRVQLLGSRYPRLFLAICLGVIGWNADLQLPKTLRMALFEESQGLHSRRWVAALGELPKDVPVYVNHSESKPFLAQRDNLFPLAKGDLALARGRGFYVQKVMGEAPPCLERHRWRNYRVCEVR